MFERALVQAKRGIDRIVEAIAKGRISDAEVDARMPELRRQRDAAEAELAVLPLPRDVIEIHPAAVAKYLSAVEELAETLSRRMVDGREEIAEPLRELIAAIVIHPQAKAKPRIRSRDGWRS